MVRLSIACLLVSLLGCGTEPDTRPETAAYISEAILVPSCGRAGCHSADAQAHGLPFDSVSDCLRTLGGSSRGERLVVPGQPDQSQLVTVLTDSRSPMPADAPLADADIALITSWVADGADGLP